jgi:3-methyladenine DNA glycosylase AlkC
VAAFKDNIDRAVIEGVAAHLRRVHPVFPAEQFVADAVDGLDGLELKARVDHIAQALGRAMPADFVEAVSIVDRAVDGTDMGMWDAWPITVWVANAGQGHADVAVELLGAITSHASAEFAIRPFIDADPVGVRVILDRWVRHEDEHRRRLVSEGTRPLLPWAPRLVTVMSDPAWAVPLLDQLVDDPSSYVRRSVANHLNDLCKLDHQLAIATAQRWVARDAGNLAVARHGLRTLVKRGDADALAVLGVDASAAIEVTGFEVLTPTVHLGDAFEFACEIHNRGTRATSVLVDYGVHLVRSNGTASRKVFKLRTVELPAGGSVQVRRRHHVKPVTVRRYYPGTHVVDVQCNGIIRASGSFDLVID